MKKEVMSVVKKSAKIAGVTFLAAGAVALLTSGAALKAITEGGKYLAKTVKDIVEEKPEQQPVVDADGAAAVEEAVQEVPAVEEIV